MYNTRKKGFSHKAMNDLFVYWFVCSLAAAK